MPIIKFETPKTKLDERIDELLEELAVMTGDDPAYAKTTKQLDKLTKIKNYDKKDSVSPDTLLVVGGNLAIALIIIGFEQKNVITSKVLGFLSKAR